MYGLNHLLARFCLVCCMVFSVQVVAKGEIIDGMVSEEINHSLRVIVINSNDYRVVSNVLVILENGNYGSLKDVRAGVILRAWLSEETGYIVKLQIVEYV